MLVRGNGIGVGTADAGREAGGRIYLPADEGNASAAVHRVDVRPNEQGLRRVGDLVRGLIAKRASLAPLVGPRRVQAVFKEGRLAAALDGDGVLPEVERPDVARVLIGSAGQD